MVSGHVNHFINTDIYSNLMQGKILFDINQMPKQIWNQIKIIILSNRYGKIILIKYYTKLIFIYYFRI